MPVLIPEKLPEIVTIDPIAGKVLVQVPPAIVAAMLIVSPVHAENGPRIDGTGSTVTIVDDMQPPGIVYSIVVVPGSPPITVPPAVI